MHGRFRKLVSHLWEAEGRLLVALLLYADPCTVNCRKVLAGAKLLQVNVSLAYRSYFEQAHHRADYLALNPNGMLPTLVHDDFVLWESDVILQYLGSLAPAGPAYPADIQVRADIHRWQAWSSAHWFDVCYPYLIENGVKGLAGEPANADLLEATGPRFHRFATVLNDHLANREWLVGGGATLADISVAAPMHVHELQKLPLSSYPRIRAWIARVEQLPCWRETDPMPHFPAPTAGHQ